MKADGGKGLAQHSFKYTRDFADWRAEEHDKRVTWDTIQYRKSRLDGKVQNPASYINENSLTSSHKEMDRKKAKGIDGVATNQNLLEECIFQKTEVIK